MRKLSSIERESEFNLTGKKLKENVMYSARLAGPVARPSLIEIRANLIALLIIFKEQDHEASSKWQHMIDYINSI